LRRNTATSPEDQRGFLVPVANPEAVGPLLAIAFAASQPDEPPPRVIALVRREGPAESDAAPSTAALTTAVQYAQARGVTIGAQAAWSAQPAVDIINAAEDAGVGWILLGYHRNAKGGNTMGGVVREVFSKARPLDINVGVFIQGTDLPIERVFVAVDAGADGRAALSLAMRIARKQQCKMRALLVSKRMTPHPEPDLVEITRDAYAELGALFHSDVLTENSLHQLFRQTPGQLLIVGKRFADEVGLPLDEVPGNDRCVIVVQGADLPDEEPPEAA
jgi:hypothetical protein